LVLPRRICVSQKPFSGLPIQGFVRYLLRSFDERVPGFGLGFGVTDVLGCFFGFGFAGSLSASVPCTSPRAAPTGPSHPGDR
jgi:hypothetical protein